MDQVFALLVVATQVSNAARITKGQTKIVCKVGGDGLRPYMAVVTLVLSLPLTWPMTVWPYDKQVATQI